MVDKKLMDEILSACTKKDIYDIIRRENLSLADLTTEEAQTIMNYRKSLLPELDFLDEIADPAGAFMSVEENKQRCKEIKEQEAMKKKK